MQWGVLSFPGLCCYIFPAIILYRPKNVNGLKRHRESQIYCWYACSTLYMLTSTKLISKAILETEKLRDNVSFWCRKKNLTEDTKWKPRLTSTCIPRVVNDNILWSKCNYRVTKNLIYKCNSIIIYELCIIIYEQQVRGAWKHVKHHIKHVIYECHEKPKLPLFWGRLWKL